MNKTTDCYIQVIRNFSPFLLVVGRFINPPDICTLPNHSPESFPLSDVGLSAIHLQHERHACTASADELTDWGNNVHALLSYNYTSMHYSELTCTYRMYIHVPTYYTECTCWWGQQAPNSCPELAPHLFSLGITWSNTFMHYLQTVMGVLSGLWDTLSRLAHESWMECTGKRKLTDGRKLAVNSLQGFT